MISAKSEVQVDSPEVRVTEWRLAPAVRPDITFMRWIMSLSP